jgi:hypothetical protein
MMDISGPGLLGAFVGTAVAALLYRPLTLLLERGIARLMSSESSEHEPIERGVLYRVVLAGDILVCAGAGYWLGATMGG